MSVDAGIEGAPRGGAPEGRSGARAGWLLAVLLSGVAFGLSWAALSSPMLFIQEMLHDVLHLIDGARRIDAGQVPHLDFSTPLGALSFAPIAAAHAWFGLSWDMAIPGGNALVAAALVPLLVWTGRSRLGFWPGLALGIYCLLLAEAMTWRVLIETATLAMSYNRWAWALSLPLAALMIVPLRRDVRPGAADLWDGLLIGLAAAALVWLKATYAAGLGLVWLVWALGAGRRRAAALSLAVGIAALAASSMAAAGGPGGAVALFQAYAADLLRVSASTIRPAPGVSALALLSAPHHAPLAAVLAICGLLLLKAGLRAPAAAWFAALAGTTIIAWQNYGNHQIALMGLGACLPALAALAAARAPELRLGSLRGPDVLRAAAIGAAFAAANHMLVMNRSVYAGWRAVTGFVEQPFDYMEAPRLGVRTALNGVVGEVNMQRASVAPAERVTTGRARELLGMMGQRSLMGRVFDDCEFSEGLPQIYAELRAAVLSQDALRGATVIGADVVNNVWMALDAPPQKGAQLWHYGPHGAALAQADLLAVPVCAISPENRNAVIDEAKETGLRLRSVASTPLWEVYRIGEGDAAW